MATGFALTLPSIFFVEFIAERAGWAAAWSALSPGPLVAIAAMLRLRRLRGVELQAAAAVREGGRAAVVPARV